MGTLKLSVTAGILALIAMGCSDKDPLSSTSQNAPQASAPKLVISKNKAGFAPKTPQGKPTIALRFDGIDDYIDCGNGASLNITGALTLEARIYASEFPGGDESGRIISKWGLNSGYELLLFNRTLHFGINQTELDASVPLDGYENQWIHVAAVWNKPESISGISNKLYLNGVLQGTGRGAFQGTIDQAYQIVPSPNNLIIGMMANLSSSTFRGEIDEVRIWNVERTEKEIKKNMNKELVGNEPGLAGYWRFNEVSGAVAADSSGNGNHGSIYGAKWVRSRR